MTIKIGDTLPGGTLTESIGQDDAKNCPMPPQPVDMAALTAGKKVVIFGLPGAYTPTCSAQHVPGYLKNFDALKAKGVDTIVCMAVNDGFVMGAWGQSQKVGDKIRMLGDGSAAFTKALGLELDLTAKGMGVRCQRFSLLVDNGVVKQVNVEGVGPANCSFAENMLAQLG
jgi:glutaredoxin/glutathione-dependent peroxiredoxin